MKMFKCLFTPQYLGKYIELKHISICISLAMVSHLYMFLYNMGSDTYIVAEN